MTRPTVLIVDDEADIRELLELTLSRMDINTHAAANLTVARTLLAEQHFDLCLTDMRLPDGNGIELVEYIQQRYANVPVALITAHGNVETAVLALKAGAFDFLSKPVDLQTLRELVRSAIKMGSDGFPQHDRRARDILLGESLAMCGVRATLAKLARSQAPVHVRGESGTGKELVVRLIHDKGPRADQPFVPVNCGAIPSELMESEFFGHRKGSFTGAVADKEGLFQAAHGGTLFLDEVAELPLHMQVKLLRVIQEKAVRPVGAQREIAVDVRILSATHKDLAALTRSGVFRQDLYYRINVIEMQVPPLRDRIEDIPQLAEHVLKRLTRQSTTAITLSDDALAALMHYNFPGNVRELENILERAIALCENNVIHADDLRLPVSEQDEEIIIAPTSAASESTSTSASTAQDAPLVSYLDRVEKTALTKALEQARYNKTAAAKLLGISLRALRYRLNRLGMD